MSGYIKPLPKRASNRTIAVAYAGLAMHTRGRLDNTKEDGRQLIALLHDYCAACANLYGEIEAANVWEILCDLEHELIAKKKLLKKDFLLFTGILRLEQPENYYVFELDELYLDETDCNPINRCFVSRELVGRAATLGRLYYFYQLIDARDERITTLCIPPNKEELLSWADPQRIYNYPQIKELKKLFGRLRVSKKSKLEDINGKPARGRLLSEAIVWSVGEKEDYEYYKKVAWRRKEMEEKFNLPLSDKLIKNLVIIVQSARNDGIDYIFEEFCRCIDSADVDLTPKDRKKIIRLFSDFNENCRKRVLGGWTELEWADYVKKALSTIRQSKEPLTELLQKDLPTEQDLQKLLQSVDDIPLELPMTAEGMEDFMESDFNCTVKMLDVKPTKGRTKKLPQRASEIEIYDAYIELARKTNGRLDRTKPEGRKLIELLHTEFAAFANLYGYFDPLLAWQFLQIIEEDLIQSKKLLVHDIVYFSDLLRLEQPAGYYVFDVEEIVPGNLEKWGTEGRLIISDDLIAPENKENMFLPFDMQVVLQKEWPLGYDVPLKKELLEWADPYYIYTTPQAFKIKDFFEKLRVPMRSKVKDTQGIPIKGRTLDSFRFISKKEREVADKYKNGAVRDDIVVSEKLSNMLILFIHTNSITSTTTMLAMIGAITETLQELDIEFPDERKEELIDLIHEANLECRTRPTNGYRLRSLNQMCDYECTDEADINIVRNKNSKLKFV